jgi:hypothetical protein
MSNKSGIYSSLCHICFDSRSLWKCRKPIANTNKLYQSVLSSFENNFARSEQATIYLHFCFVYMSIQIISTEQWLFSLAYYILRNPESPGLLTPVIPASVERGNNSPTFKMWSEDFVYFYVCRTIWCLIKIHHFVIIFSFLTVDVSTTPVGMSPVWHMRQPTNCGEVTRIYWIRTRGSSGRPVPGGL